MPSTAQIDLAAVAASLGLPSHPVEVVVELLDSGNTVPFITRYRKDQTGGLDEEQIRQIQARVVRARQLAERRESIIRSIDSQGQLTPELQAAIEAADTMRQLEDLYLPFRPRKQTLATVARERGLETLAREILDADPSCADLDLRAADFVNPDRKVSSAADALLGAGHILAEWFSERADLRGKLRAIIEQTGKLVSSAIEPPEKVVEVPAVKSAAAPEAPTVEQAITTEETVAIEESVAAETPAPEVPAAGNDDPGAATPADDATGANVATENSAAEATQLESVELADAGDAAPLEPAAAEAKPPAPPRAAKGKPTKQSLAQMKREQLHKAFRDYFQFSEPLSKLPPHRVLAINRGEKFRILRVRVDSDMEAIHRLVDELLIPADHPHAEFLRGCARDALVRLVLPSLEREVRREIADRAEAHAVKVFARNLRQLLLQPPVRQKRVLALDPGFRSGCKYVALDEFGNPLEHGTVHLVGKEDRINEAKQKIVEVCARLQAQVIAIGNGTACRQTERFVADLVTGPLAEQGVRYVIVNEAGASVYSTSRAGREEFPKLDATVRGSISIGRRLLDPLSELVKIEPPSLGVGLYQHDLKAKHLRDSLDTVVESCVNFVGVDLNTASPALLRYVSGLNQLTAQRVYEHRATNGPFRTREQLQEIPGVGESSYVQAAGFLKISAGDNPLDATWIHPESYDVAREVLSRLGATPADLLDRERLNQISAQTASLDLEQLSGEMQVGVLTLRDIVAQLVRPGRDPRESLPPPIFKQGILKLEDLEPGMELTGTVLNVVDFGAFVDIGLKDSGLVHVSQLSDQFVKDPHDVVSVGDIVNVWVLDVDKQRRRVRLSMVDPAKRRAPPQKPRGEERSGAPAGQRPQSQGRPPRQGSGGPPQGGRRPQGQGRGRPQKTYTPPQPKPKPKPVVPITDEMKKGKAPLRTFGDLMQFWNLKQPEEGEQPPESPKSEGG